MAKLKFLKRVGYSDINTLQDDDSAFFFEAGMMIDADGGFHAYNPDNKSGLDYLGNAGKPGNWWALVTDNGKPSGNPVIQGASDPAPGFYISTTSLEDGNVERKDPRRYVNAEAVNFFVLPGRLGLGAKLGDFGVVIRSDRNDYDYAVYADVGPAAKIGEASIALAASLGIPSSPKTGGIGHGIIYIVFPGSQKDWPVNQAQIDQHAATLFASWGGLEKAKECFPSLNWLAGAPRIEIGIPV
ncbi:MAG: glycoside hydrolase family 75 protein [Chthoniobacterales bacterium]